MNAAALRRTHLGSAHDGGDGVVTWSEATTAKTLELITSRTRDAVAAYAWVAVAVCAPTQNALSFTLDT